MLGELLTMFIVALVIGLFTGYLLWHKNNEKNNNDI